MQKLINQILEGNFDYENGSLDFSCAKIEISVKKDEIYEGSFHIYGTPGMFTGGSVISSDWRMECLNKEFIGTDEEIFFRFHGTTLEEGDVVKGNFYIISNQGEYYIPFVVNVERSMVESTIGGIKNLFHFANLAKSNWQEAVRLFYSPEFTRIFNGSDTQYFDDYRALSAYSGVEQNMEEFLIRINKKQKVEFLTEEESLTVELPVYDAGYHVAERQLTIVKNGWGYTNLYVECTGDFLFTEKEILTDDDFLGTYCRLPVFVDSSFCRKGKNYGQICLYNSYVTLNIPVIVKVGADSGRNTQRLTEKRSMVQLMEFYQAYRMHKISTATWLKETGKLVDRLVAMDENNIAARLFQAQLLITEERRNEAGWILDHVADLFEKQQADDTLMAYYLYLTTLIHDEVAYVVKVTSKVEHIYRQNNSNWRVGWLLLYLSEEYHKSPAGKWSFLEKQFKAGCTSPVIYIEALSLLNYNPTLLRKLGQFEQQVLYYGTRQDSLKSETIEQMLYLVEKEKEYSEVLFKTLKNLYQKKRDARLLREICTLLIKGGKVGRQYFDWYKAGVEAKLRITNLYEYYMMSLDLDKQQDIPKIVLMYFSYQNNLDYTRAAYLYDYVLQHREKISEIYETYRLRIEAFALEQVKRGRINRHLANIYNLVLKREMITGENCGIFSKLLFANYIRVEDTRLQKVYVYHQGSTLPAEYQLCDGGTWVALYGSNYTIVFEDAWQNRFIKNVEYTIEKLLMPAKFIQWLMDFDCDNLQLDMYLCEGERAEKEAPENNAIRMARILNSDYASAQVKREFYLRIIQYYYEANEEETLKGYLEAVPIDRMHAAEKNRVVEYMVLSGNYEMAGRLLEHYGPYFVDAKLLVRFIGVLIEQRNMENDPVLLAAAVYAFKKGKYDGCVLEYLMMHYQGMSRNLREIWKAARAYGVDCYKLSERILVQMLYSGAFVGEKMDMFRYYISHGAKPEVEEALLAQCSYDYFVRSRVTEAEVFEEIQKMYQRGEPIQRVCKLALLKYCAENSNTGSELADNEMVECFLRELMEEGIHLEIFRAFKQFDFIQQELSDKTIIEYYANPGCRASIHYVVFGDNGESDKYVAEYMREAYRGVYFKEFVLFFGESLQYYITEEKDGEEQLTESGTLQKSDIGGVEEDSKYRLINDIVISKNLQDYDTMDKLLEEYHRKDYLNGRFFEVK